MLHACFPFCLFFYKQDCIPNMNFHDINLDSTRELNFFLYFIRNIMEVDLYSLILYAFNVFFVVVVVYRCDLYVKEVTAIED